MGSARDSFIAALAGVVVLLCVQDAWAGGPATHVKLAADLFSNLSFLPAAVAAIIHAHRRYFAYGNVATDTVLAKKMSRVKQVCHRWGTGFGLLDSAETDEGKAFGFGYLAHLAADTVAHNLFVPRQLLLTSTTQAIGHTYWEHRMDLHVGESFLAEARELVMEHDHEEADSLFDEVLSRTIFSFQTNRRIFRGMIRISDNDRWQQVFEQVLKNSRFDLPDDLVEEYFALSFEHVVGYLAEGATSAAAALDPVGDLNLRLAKKVRRLTMARGGVEDPALLERTADEFFPLPDDPPRYSRVLSNPLTRFGSALP